MADAKISALTAATTPLVGTEVLPIVQSGVTTKVSVANLTAGRAVSALSYASTTGANFATLSGNVGVGTSSPGFKLEVDAANVTVYTASNTLNSGASAYLYNNSVTDFTAATLRLDVLGGSTANLAATSISAVHLGNGLSALTFGTRNGPAVPVVEQVRIGSNGDLKVNTGNLVQGTAAKGITTGGAFALGFGTNGSTTQMSLNATGSLSVFQAPTASAPTYVKGAMYFDTTLNKLRIGGATDWETVTSV